MIENERQYLITKKRLGQFEQSLASLRSAARPAKVPSRIHRAMIEGAESQLADLKQEISEYDALKERRVKELVLRSLNELPDLLIKTRIARGYTQAELAEKLKMKAQQIQRYESTRYRSVSFWRLLEVARILNLDLNEKVRL